MQRKLKFLKQVNAFEACCIVGWGIYLLSYRRNWYRGVGWHYANLLPELFIGIACRFVC